MSSEQPVPATPPNRKWNLHYIVGVSWITYWMSNLYIGFSYAVPFLNYYVMTALLLIYIAFFRPNSLIAIASKPMFWLWIMTVVIPAVMYLDSSFGAYSTGAIKTRIIYLSAIGGMALVLLDENRERILRSAATLSLAITVTLNVIDIIFTLPIARAEGRASGLWMDPNIAAAVLGSMLIIAVDPRRPTRRGLVLVAITLLAILITFSRSGVLFGAFLGFLYLFGPRGPESLPISTRLNIALGASLSLAVGSVIVLSVSGLELPMIWRLESMFNLDLSDTSAQGRLEAFSWALDRAMDFFWTGRGLGASAYYGVFSHNAYITVLYDYGIVGLLIYVFFISQGLFQFLRFGWKRAAIPGLLSINLLYYGMFAHTLPNSAGLAVPMAIFMLKIFIDLPQNRMARSHAVVNPPNAPGVLQPEQVQ